uniref:Guanine nucleotide-binding protein subunit alpha-14-like n=1 Tax=Hirondellea gigas TaxID=1518452 RepID=A0A6A7G1V2_9CRUS
MGGCLVVRGEQKEPLQEVPADKKKKIKPIKLLLLGTGESGKSTLFNRFLMDHGDGMSDEDRIDYAQPIFQLVIRSMQLLIQASVRMNDDYDSKITPEISAAVKLIMSLRPDHREPLTTDMADAITLLWNDSLIQAAFQYRSAVPELPDTCPYFFEHVNKLTASQFIPSPTDVLRCRCRTTGIHAQHLESTRAGDNTSFEIVDVGGQRAERRKWKNVFDQVNLILFVVSVAEFDQVCFEDVDTNRLEESLTMFEKTTNSGFFQDTPILLIFNKTDVLREKLKSSYRNKFQFRDYDGPVDDELQIRQFLDKSFVESDRTTKPLKTVFICAIDESLDLSVVVELVLDLLDEGKEKLKQKALQNSKPAA